MPISKCARRCNQIGRLDKWRSRFELVLCWIIIEVLFARIEAHSWSTAYQNDCVFVIENHWNDFFYYFEQLLSKAFRTECTLPSKQFTFNDMENCDTKPCAFIHFNRHSIYVFVGCLRNSLCWHRMCVCVQMVYS